MKETKEVEKSKVTYHSFVVHGDWFTWILRHLWIEGSESKAVRIWSAAFPQFEDVKHLKGAFLDIVSGKKKFIGNTRDGLEFVEEGTRHWSPVAGGEPSPNFPLLQSWEDVILRKKVKLFISELELRSFRYYRRGPQTYEMAGHNSMTWARGVDENKQENYILMKTGKLWTEIMNLGMTLGLDAKAFMIPIEMKGWSELSMQTKKESWWVQTDLGTQVYQNIMAVLDPIVEYFQAKYGDDMVHFDSDWIREFVCNIHPYEQEAMLRQGRKELRWDEVTREAEKKASVSSLGSMTVDKYISQQMAAKETPKEEDPFETKWDSGYVDREGKFYGCPDLDHIGFARDVVKHFGIKYTPRKSTKTKQIDSLTPDLQYVLDDKGWVKVSARRFYYEKKPNEKQIDSIGLFMTGKEMTHALFNKQYGDGVTFEAFVKGLR